MFYIYITSSQADAMFLVHCRALQLFQMSRSISALEGTLGSRYDGGRETDLTAHKEGPSHSTLSTGSQKREQVLKGGDCSLVQKVNHLDAGHINDEGILVHYQEPVQKIMCVFLRR